MPNVLSLGFMFEQYLWCDTLVDKLLDTLTFTGSNIITQTEVVKVSCLINRLWTFIIQPPYVCQRKCEINYILVAFAALLSILCSYSHHADNFGTWIISEKLWHNLPFFAMQRLTVWQACIDLNSNNWCINIQPWGSSNSLYWLILKGSFLWNYMSDFQV